MDVVISTSTVVLGCILAIVPLGAGVAIGGYMLIILGFLLALMMKSEYREELSGEKYQKQEYFFPKRRRTSCSLRLHLLRARLIWVSRGKGRY